MNEQTEKAIEPPLTWLRRSLAEEVEESLNVVCVALSGKQEIEPPSWKFFYEFILVASYVKRSLRPSVSQLFDRFQEQNVPYPGKLAVLYAHGLHLLAMKIDGEEGWEKFLV